MLIILYVGVILMEFKFCFWDVKMVVFLELEIIFMEVNLELLILYEVVVKVVGIVIEEVVIMLVIE